MSHLTDISDFAHIKADEFYQNALAHRNQVIMQSVLLSMAALIVLVCIGYYFRRGLVPPIKELTGAAEAMRQGRLDTRAKYEAANEIGVLSKAFNKMAETIETETKLKDDMVQVSSVMFHEDSLRPFCQELLKSLMKLTGSQIGAIYFLNEAKSNYEPYETIGAKTDNLSSFSAMGKEGEFGTVLASKSVQHITDIPSDTKVIFSAVCGDYKVKEIISIPVIDGSEVVSIISIASIKSYSAASLRLVTSLTNEISARISTIMASKKIFEFSQKLQATKIGRASCRERV